VSPLPLRIANAEWLRRPETRAVFAALAAKGYDARAVGGAVRNALAGEPVTDVDIASAALPADVIAAAEAAGLKAVPTGVDHGTVTIVSGDRPHEVTTLREDVETHGRHATVAFTDDWVADARRRDFTANALYCTANGEVFDPLGGYADIVARRVRFIGDPVARIREDYLRILRFFRFNAAFGKGSVDADSLSACVRERDGLAILSAERVRQELMRLLATPRAAEIVNVMFDHGLIVPVLGAAPRPALLARLAAIEAQQGLLADPALRLAVLSVAVVDDVDRLQDRLRLSNVEKEILALAATDAADLSTERAAEASLYKDGGDTYRRRILLAWTFSGDGPAAQAWQERLGLPGCWSVPRLSVGGQDVIALGVPAGPRVGQLLRQLEHWWIAGNFAATETQLREKLRQLASAG
jgi:poly(A) polymerase